MVVEAKPLDIVEQRVGLRHERTAPGLYSVVIGSLDGRGGHCSNINGPDALSSIGLQAGNYSEGMASP